MDHTRDAPAGRRIATSSLLRYRLLAALSEAALHIARSTDRATAFDDGQAAVSVLLDRLVGG